MQEIYNGIWREIASRIRPHLSTDAFQRWFAAIELVEADEIALTFQVPNSIYQFWIESNYLNVVESAAIPCSEARDLSTSIPQIAERSRCRWRCRP